MSEKSDGGFRGAVIYPAMLAALYTLGTWVWAKVQGVQWKTVIEAIPSKAYWVALVVALVWAVIWRRHAVNRSNRRYPHIVAIPWDGYSKIGLMPWDGVKWTIVLPNNARSFRRSHPDDVKVQAPPLCPNILPNGKACETELDETKGFWGSYVWSCERCQFQTKSSASQWERADKLTPVAKAEARDRWHEITR